MTHKWFVDGMEVTTKLEEALVNGFIDLKKRVEALETYLKHCVDALAKLDEDHLTRGMELRALEITKAKYDVEHWLPEMDERRRVDRWHATRDAYVTGMAAAGEISGEFILKQAAKCADLAHGPLEGHPGRENDDDPSFHVAVDALVKAIKAYRAEANRNDALISIGVYVALDNALKPFEAVKP